MSSGMRSYIGTKIVGGEPQKDPKWDPSKEAEAQDGYRVVYEDGYVSWCPKATFERNNREITEAEKALIFTED